MFRMDIDFDKLKKSIETANKLEKEEQKKANKIKMLVNKAQMKRR